MSDSQSYYYKEVNGKLCTYCEGRSRIYRNGRYGFIDEDGTLIIQCVYERASFFHNGFSIVRKDGRLYNWIDRYGNLLREEWASMVGFFSEGAAYFRVSKGFGFINAAGNIIIEPSFWGVGTFHRGLAPVCNEDGLWGYINQKGEYAIKPQYERAESFALETAKVELNGESFRINAIGERLG